MRGMQDEYYDFGYKYFGPFLYGFVKWLKNELVSRSYKKVFFFSRDGYMMKKAFDHINDTDIESHYVYFSRRSLRVPLFNKCDNLEESLEYMAWKRFISINELSGYYGLDNNNIVMPDYGENEKVINFDNLKTSRFVSDFYEKNKVVINKLSLEQEKYLLQYTEQCGMRGRFAIVDIGWHGNMQYYLERLYRTHGLEFDVSGFYLGILPEKKFLSEVNGFVFAPGNITNRKRMLCFLGGYEKLFQSTEGSVSGYSDQNGIIVPELAEYEYSENKDIIDAIDKWQNGAMKFISHTIGDADIGTTQKLIEPLINFGMAPKLRDTQLFGFFYIDDGAKIWFTAQKSLWKYKPKEFLLAFGNSPWKTGFLKSAFRLPLPYYLVYCIIKK